MTFVFEFQKDYTLEERLLESQRVREKHPTKIPIICELHPNDINSHYPRLHKSKYLVTEDLSAAQFMQVIRNKMKLNENIAIFIIINGRMASSSQPLNMLYKRYKHTDGFMYVHYCFEHVFG